MQTKIKDFWIKYEAKIIFVVGFILVALLSFQAGILEGREIKQAPIIIEKPVLAQDTTESPSRAQILTSETNNIPSGDNIQNQANSINEQKCAFVGSKNSNKYHLPTCRYAKNISSENLVCFSSADEAKSRGYLPDKNCIK